MKRNRLFSLAALLFLPLLPACPFNGDRLESGPLSGDVTFRWTFAGASCDRADIASVHVTIPGESLPNNGYFPCRDSARGLDGAVLTDFVGGTYNFTVEGLYSDSDVPAFVGNGSFKVDGGAEVDIDLGIK